MSSQVYALARRFCIAVVVLLFTGHLSSAAAQLQSRGDASQTSPATGHIHGAPLPAEPSTGRPQGPPPGRFESTLKFEPRPRDDRRAPLPFDAATRARSLGYYDVPWSWNGVTQDYGVGVQGVTVPPSATIPAGGLQLDVQPWGAEVYVDGQYAGHVSEFTGYYRPLELAAGSHVIAIVARDYDPLIFPVLTAPGATQTYRGTLSRTPGH